jgi:hypothetical protein
MSNDRMHLYDTWEFMPPDGSDEEPQQMTFDNGRLLMFGVAASGSEEKRSQVNYSHVRR